MMLSGLSCVGFAWWIKDVCQTSQVSLSRPQDCEMLLNAQAEPLAGGQLLGSGRMWVSPSGEVDPRAVKVRFEGRNLPTETLLKRYLPKVGCPHMQISRDAIALHPSSMMSPITCKTLAEELVSDAFGGRGDNHK